MKNFLKEIGLSFYSSIFYQKAKDRDIGQTIGFVAKVCLFLGICLGLIAFIFLLVFSGSIKNKVYNFAQEKYPNDLTIVVKDGTLTTNTNEPYFFKIPTEKENKITKENAIAILPNEKVDSNLLSKYSTYVALTADGLVAENENSSEIRIMKYQGLSLTIDKNILLQKIQKFIPIFFVALSIMAIPFFVVFVFTMAIGHFIWLFFVSLLIWAFLSLKKLKISYRQSYLIGAHALAPLLILEIIAFPFNFRGPLFTIAIILIIVLFVTHGWKEEKIIENQVENMLK